MPELCIVRCFDEQQFSLQLKEMCHLSPNCSSSLRCPSTPVFCLNRCFQSSFWGAEGFIVSFHVCLSLSFSSFVILLIQNLEPDLCLCSQWVWISKMRHFSSHLVCARRWVDESSLGGLHVLLPFLSLNFSLVLTNKVYRMLSIFSLQWQGELLWKMHFSENQFMVLKDILSFPIH